MYSIRPLFESFSHSNLNIPKKYKKRIERECMHIKDADAILPKVSFPPVDSIDHEEDLEKVKFYYNNPSLDDSFLMTSDRSVEDCFKLFCEELGINPDWKVITDLLNDVDTIILKLKYAHNRPRPKFYLKHEGVPYASIKDCKSPSFPSGHTTIAFFISEILSAAYPELRQD